MNFSPQEHMTMVSKSTAGLPKEGSTMKQTEHNTTFAKGGNTPMFGKGDRTVTAPLEQAGHKDAGTTDQGSHDGGTGDKFAKGGTNKMFGYAGSQPAEAGKTSAR
jgi:hypothetical protein